MTQSAPAAADILRRLRQAAPEAAISADEPLSAHTTLRLGGPAAYFAQPGSVQQLQALLRAAAALSLPVTVMGHGSNLLVRDGGVDGLVLCIGSAMARMDILAGELQAEAGASLGALARYAARHGLGGLSFAAGIPGTVGGGTLMNAGAYGGEMAQVVAWVEGCRLDGTLFRYTAEELGFAYRHSRLMGEGSIITRVGFRLTEADPEALQAEMADLARRRAEKQPLDVPSAGSTFKRPEGAFAAALIDQCGLKGCQVGGAQVSEKHAGFLINRGGTAADFLALMRLVRETVQARTGITLEAEVQIIGHDIPAGDGQIEKQTT